MENPARNVLATDYELKMSVVLLKNRLQVCPHSQARLGGGDRPAVRQTSADPHRAQRSRWRSISFLQSTGSRCLITSLFQS
jgi:hypothetical protein